MNKKICLVHFQALEKYPPVMNIINYLAKKDEFKLFVFSTQTFLSQELIFNNENTIIARYGFVSKSQTSASRMFQTIKFYVRTFFDLVKRKPTIIVYYETLSVLPVFFYVLLRPSVKLIIHHHEYSTKEEYKRGPLLVRMLLFFERRMYAKAAWISQTNEQRLRLFSRDNPLVHAEKLHTLPNYPPEDWYHATAKRTDSLPVKFVYVGSLSLDTMYTREFAHWIEGLNGKATWDIYSGNFSSAVHPFFQDLNCPFIAFKGQVSYYKLPDILAAYDVGIIFYNGHIPNYVHNIPNKLFEYHACGLDVWFSNELKGSLELVTSGTSPQICNMDFANLPKLDTGHLLSRQHMQRKILKRTDEDSFCKLYSFLINN